MLESGVLLSDRYRLEERVATGGMGDVWRATDLVLDRRVAVKVLLPALLADPGFIARFRAEARMMAALHTPGVVQVYDSGETTLPGGGRADYLVMEYVDGEPLSHRLAGAERLDVTETMSIVAQAARALHAAHLAGIVHRDVKPSNLLVQADGTVVLVDFGVARSTAVTSITGTNAVPGTALYMAPEQALGKPVSAATDIYALGAVAYHCLAGRTPFTGDNPLEVAIKHTQDEPPPLPADLPAPVAALVERTLAKDPGARFPDAEALSDAARAIVAGGPVASDDDDTVVGVVPWTGTTRVGAAPSGAGPRTLTDLPPISTVGAGPPSRNRAAAVALVAVVLVFAVAGLATAWSLTDDEKPPATGPTPTTQPATAGPTPSASAEDDPDRGGSGTGRPTGRPERPEPGPSAVTTTAAPEPTEAEPSADPEPTEPPDDNEPSEPVDDPPGTTGPGSSRAGDAAGTGGGDRAPE
nr:protein kinase [Micromonospora sp. DSM 115978]